MAQTACEKGQEAHAEPETYEDEQRWRWES